MSRRKILHVVTWLNRGGLETWLTRYVSHVHRGTDWQIDILCRGAEEGVLADSARSLGSNVTLMPMKLATPMNAFGLAKHVERGRYDLVHGHLNSHNSLVVQAARRAGVPSVAMFHNERLLPQPEQTASRWQTKLASWYVRWSVNYVLRHASCIAPVSSAVKNSLNQLHGAPLDRMFVVHLGSNRLPPISEAARQVVRREVFRCRSDEQSILHVGSFCSQKNHAGILATFAALRSGRENVKLVLVGGGPLEKEIVDLISAHPFRSDIQYLGSRDDVGDLMQAADCFFLPSHHEGLPIVLMEAFAARLPVVASDIPSIREAFGANSCAKFFHPSDFWGFSQQLGSVLRSAEYSNQLRLQGIERFENLFSIQASANRLDTVYRKLLCNIPAINSESLVGTVSGKIREESNAQ